MRIVHHAVCAAAVAVILLAAAVPVLAAEARELSVQISNDGTLLVVADPVKTVMAVYRISSNSVTLLATRDLAQDLAGETAKSLSPAPPPTSDVPGEDPPDFRRPESSVRIGAAHRLEQGEERWDAWYLVAGTVEGVYEKVRMQSRDWRVPSERMTQHSTAEIWMVREGVEMHVSVRKAGRLEGWIELEVGETRKQP